MPHLTKPSAKTSAATAHSIFDLYHNINNPESFRNIIEVHPIAEQFLKRPEYSERGLVVAGLHMGSFDFIGQAAGISGVKGFYLGLPTVNSGYQKQIEMRRERGMNIIPTNPGTIKQAIKYLRAGGMVLTGIDRPDESYPYRPALLRSSGCPPHPSHFHRPQSPGTDNDRFSDLETGWKISLPILRADRDATASRPAYRNPP